MVRKTRSVTVAGEFYGFAGQVSAGIAQGRARHCVTVERQRMTKAKIKADKVPKWYEAYLPRGLSEGQPHATYVGTSAPTGI